MLTIKEIAPNDEGKRQFEISDFDRQEGEQVVVVTEGAYKVGLNEDGTPKMKEVIFLPKGNSVNQLGVALSKFDAKTKDMDEKVFEVAYRESHPRSSTSAPKSSKLEKYATDEQKARLAELESAVKERVQEQKEASEADIEAYKIAMAEYNLAMAYAKRDGTECEMTKPRDPRRVTGSFIDLLTEDEYAEYQGIIAACEEAKKNAPRASRKLSDDEKIARKEKALAEKKAAFLAKYGKEL